MNENKMISAEEATEIVLDHTIDPGNEWVSLEDSVGRVTAENICADRDLPPFDRAMMDGIAIASRDFANGISRFVIQGTQYAGATPLSVSQPGECIEIMTGASLHPSLDCVIRYEDLSIDNGVAELLTSPSAGQSIHKKGSDTLKDSVLIHKNTPIGNPEIAVAAAVGAAKLLVKKHLRVIIISSGDEIVDIDQTPGPEEIRNSNAYLLSSLLRQHGILAEKVHVPDDENQTRHILEYALKGFDVILLCGGVSKGKKDHIPQALEASGVVKHFHQVSQRPGKPFWFGRHEKAAVFALPGNPVSTFMCARRYFVPWLLKSSGQEPMSARYAILAEDYDFKPELTYFLQVKIYEENALRFALPVTGGGSGDFSNMLKADGFLELPLQTNSLYKKGDIFRFWTF